MATEHWLFTDRGLKALKPAAPGARDTHWDTGKPGFGVRTTEQTATPFVMRRLAKSVEPAKRRVVADSWRIPLRRGQPLPTSLTELRVKAETALKDMRDGVDPYEKKKAEAADKKRRSDSALSVATERFIDEHVSGLRRAKEAARAIRNQIVPRLGADRLIGDVTREDVVNMLLAVAKPKKRPGKHGVAGELRGGKGAARHLFSYTRAFFEWAIAIGSYGLTASPCDRVKIQKILGAKPLRQRVLTDHELRELWRATRPDGQIGYPFGAFIRLLLMTGQRLREVANARWSEFDLDNAVWTIPAARMKGDRAHEVPLAPLVVGLLKAVPRGNGPFVFSTTNGQRPIAGFSKMKARLDRMLKDVDPWRPHDLRRTLRTRMGGLPVPTNVAELVIGHAQPGLHRVYDLYAYRDEKRRALTLWAQALLAIVEPPPANVISLTRGTQQ
jgi:integrase